MPESTVCSWSVPGTITLFFFSSHFVSVSGTFLIWGHFSSWELLSEDVHSMPSITPYVARRSRRPSLWTMIRIWLILVSSVLENRHLWKKRKRPKVWHKVLNSTLNQWRTLSFPLLLYMKNSLATSGSKAEQIWEDPCQVTVQRNSFWMKIKMQQTQPWGIKTRTTAV